MPLLKERPADTFADLITKDFPYLHGLHCRAFPEGALEDNCTPNLAEIYRVHLNCMTPLNSHWEWLKTS